MTQAPWTLDDEINEHLATLELPPEPVVKQYMAERKPIEAAAPKTGDHAPDFSVELLTDSGSRSGINASLSSFRGRNLALIFGNYTCPIYRGQFEVYREMHAQYKEQLSFLMIYVKEEHPEDGWQLDINRAQSCIYYQPASADERAGIAADFMQRFAVEMPVAIDAMDNSVCTLYAGSPERLYVIDAEGVVTHHSDPGPFAMDAVEAWCAAVRESAA